MGSTGNIWVKSAFCVSFLVGGQAASDTDRQSLKTKQSQFLMDVARYLTGSEEDAESVQSAYRRRTDPRDKKLVYPPEKHTIEIPDDLETLWKTLGLDKEVFPEPNEAPDAPTWQSSQSNRWKRRLEKNSRVKGKDRWIYRLRKKKGETGISVAQTENETEFAIQRENGSRDWDFIVYNKAGKLAAESTFTNQKGKTIRGPSPLVCLTCHYDRNERIFSNVPMNGL